MPSILQTAFLLDAQPPSNSADLTALASVAHLPAISLPMGVDAQGLPMGLQIVAASYADDALLAVSAEMERALRSPQRNGKSGVRFSFNAAMPS
jgi:Asp-tRNA(Asn)/Glu-tRNA(Gln) amidotransferase A subunit family amidase